MKQFQYFWASSTFVLLSIISVLAERKSSKILSK